MGSIRLSHRLSDHCLQPTMGTTELGLLKVLVAIHEFLQQLYDRVRVGPSDKNYFARPGTTIVDVGLGPVALPAS